MQLAKLSLMSKNNKRDRRYLYSPIMEDNGKYFWCESIKTDRPLNKKTVDLAALKIRREIPPEYYKANGLPAAQLQQN